MSGRSVSTAVAERSTVPALVPAEDHRPEVMEADRQTPGRAVHRSAGGGFGDVGIHPSGDAGRGDRLRVSSPGDPAERQAERVADRVVRGLPAFEGAPAQAGPVVGRVAADAEEGEEVSDGIIEPGEEPEDEVSPAEVHASRDGGPARTPAGFADAVAGGAAPGATIPAGAHATLARSFGRSFADVRLHRGDRADALARSISAQAFTWGNDVYLAGTAPTLDRPEGLRLVAHELAHVCQQSSTPRTRTVHRSDALYVSTRGRPGYYDAAIRFHREHGWPTPVRVSSVEELVDDLIGRRTGLSRVRLVSHAVPAGIFLPLLPGGSTSLFEQDLALQTQGALEGELSTEHPTVGPQNEVRTLEHHVLTRDWATDVYARMARERDFAAFRAANRLPATVTQGGDLESLLWWLVDREVLTAERPLPARRGRAAGSGHVLGMREAQRVQAVASVSRNLAIYRNLAVLHLVAAGPRTGTADQRRARAEAAVTELEQRAVRAAGQLVDEAVAGPGLRVQLAVPSARYESIQGAIERGTFTNNLLTLKSSLPHQLPFEIRGCRIGQNAPWLAKFRDFWGLGIGGPPTGRRPDVSAPDLRHIFGTVVVRSGRRTTRSTAEWLEGPRRRQIRGGTAEFDQHIVHAR